MRMNEMVTWVVTSGLFCFGSKPQMWVLVSIYGLYTILVVLLSNE